MKLVRALTKNYHFFLIILVAFFSLNTILGYYFYTDDYSILYHIQNNIYPGWPYNGIIFINSQIYNLFGLSPLPYHVIGLFIYIIDTILVFYFVNAISKNKKIAIVSGMIFSTGYVGLDQFTMSTIAITNNLSILGVLLTLIFLVYWLNLRRIIFFFLALFCFWISIVIFPQRSFPLVIFIPTLIFVFHLNEIVKLNLRPFIKDLVWSVIFIFIAFKYGIFSYGTKAVSTGVIPAFTNLKIFRLLETDNIIEFFAILGRFILNPITDIFKLSTEQPYFQIGLMFFLSSIVIGLFLIKRNIHISRSILIFIFFTVQGYIGNMILLPEFDANGAINRYLTIAFIGFSATVASLFFVFTSGFGRRGLAIFVLLSLVFILVLGISSSNYEKQILRERSEPARNFHKELINYVPEVKESTTFYFDSAEYSPVASRFGSILLGAFLPREATLAVHYNVSISYIKIVDNFDSFLEVLKTNRENAYSFYFDEKGLQETTNLILLSSKGSSKNLSVGGNNDKFNPKLYINTNNSPSLVPSVLAFTLIARPINFSDFKFPYCHNLDENLCNEFERKYKKLDKKNIFEYLLSRINYYKKVKVSASSSHVAGKNGPSLMIDENDETSWISSQFELDEGKNPNLEIDLGEEREVGKIIWETASNRAILGIDLFFSIDGESWDKRKFTVQKDGSQNIISFDPIITRFIRILINKTEVNAPPVIKEIEVIDSKFLNINRDLYLEFNDNPFILIKDQADLALSYDFVSQNTKLKIKTLTNKDSDIDNRYMLSVPILFDGFYHTYSANLSPRGTVLKEIIFELNFPAELGITELNLEYPKNLTD